MMVLAGICGFCSFERDFLQRHGESHETLLQMGRSLSHRGGKGHEYFLNENTGLFLNKTDHDGMLSFHPYKVMVDGELYNKKEIRTFLQKEGVVFQTESDAETILACYRKAGASCASWLNGVFAFALWDQNRKRLVLCRDRLGIKPLFYTFHDHSILFASEMKALFQYPGVTPTLDADGLCELLGLFPSRTEGNGVFRGIREIRYGSVAVFEEIRVAEGRIGGIFHEESYWRPESAKHPYSYAETVEKTRFLVTDAIRRQVPGEGICSFLSGGIDSGIVTAVAAAESGKQGKPFDTFSFDYEDNALYFQSNAFQADRDTKWAQKTADLLQTNHRLLECGIDDLIGNLYHAVDARDLPGMADVDSSLLYFCAQVSQTHSIALTGECSDELFGGYPWFHSKEALEGTSFPWIRNTEFRRSLLSDDLLASVDIDGYVRKRYEETVAAVPKLPEESEEDAQHRKLLFLNIKWFMTNLIDRMDRMSMYSGLTARVPFADYRIVEFLWNTPWSMKCNGTPKSLLREAFCDVLPDELINRKKSPYPKTYHPLYEKKLQDELIRVLDDPSSPVLQLVDKQKVLDFLKMPSDYGKPWYGQLMAGPQLKAFYLQLNDWLVKYRVKIAL